jgi:hypothetical protein
MGASGLRQVRMFFLIKYKVYYLTISNISIGNTTAAVEESGIGAAPDGKPAERVNRVIVSAVCLSMDFATCSVLLSRSF